MFRETALSIYSGDLRTSDSLIQHVFSVLKTAVSNREIRSRPAFSVNAKHLYWLGQCRRRWDDVVQIMYKWFVFAGVAVSCLAEGNVVVICT